MIVVDNKDNIAIKTNTNWVFYFKPEAKEELVKNVPNLASGPKIVELMVDPEVLRFTHRLDGPAIYKEGSTNPEEIEYWVNGQFCDEGIEEFKRVSYDPKFHKDFSEKVLGDDEETA